jgi:hypothetical protein
VTTAERTPAEPTAPDRSPERTLQQLDPAAALGGRVPAITTCALALTWAVVVVLFLQGDNHDPTLTFLAVGLLFAAATVIVVATAPALAPFTMREHLTVHLLTLSAFLVNLIASWGIPRTPQDTWVSACLGLFLAGISAYRPARELVLFGTASMAIIGVFTFFSANASPGGTRPLALVLFAILPALACCYGAARYSRGTVRDYVQWRNRLNQAVAAEADTVHNEIYTAVQIERVGNIAREVMPLLDDILYQENITEEHRAQARAIATRIRGGLVEEVDRTWLQTVIAPLQMPTGRPLHLDDPDRLASHMNVAQRTALHALVSSLVDDVSARDLSITLYGQGDVATVTVAAGINSRRRTVHARTRHGLTRHARYSPFLAVMRTTFDDLTAEFGERDLIVKFDYAYR